MFAFDTVLIDGPMTQESASRRDLEKVLQRFPENVQAIRERFLADPAFRSICEEYRLARTSLEELEGRSPTSPQSEVEDLRRVAEELEAEIGGILRTSRRSS